MHSKISKVLVLIIGLFLWTFSSYTVFAQPSIPDETAAYLDKILPWVVPNNTPQEKVPLICAIYESRVIEYDYELQDKILENDIDACREGWEYYHNPERSFETEKGLCSSYSGIHSMMVSSVPINPKTQRVDYQCKSPVYLKSSMVRSARHIFSAVSLNKVWHLYDPGWYDTSGGEDCYLDITDKEIMEDESHRDWYFVN